MYHYHTQKAVQRAIRLSEHLPANQPKARTVPQGEQAAAVAHLVSNLLASGIDPQEAVQLVYKAIGGVK